MLGRVRHLPVGSFRHVLATIGNCNLFLVWLWALGPCKQPSALPTART